MSLLFETIKILDGEPRHLYWHNIRLNRSRREFWHPTNEIDLTEMIRVPEEFRTGLVSCNVYYEKEVQNITFKAYIRREIRRLRLVFPQFVDYHVKYTDRSVLEFLLTQKGECDDIIIVMNGFLTDTSVSNLIFFNGNDWITPENPLLTGVTRERLLSEGKIKTGKIRDTDLNKYEGCKLINAMREPEYEPLIPVQAIFK